MVDTIDSIEDASASSMLSISHKATLLDYAGIFIICSMIIYLVCGVILYFYFRDEDSKYLKLAILFPIISSSLFFISKILILITSLNEVGYLFLFSLVLLPISTTMAIIALIKSKRKLYPLLALIYNIVFLLPSILYSFLVIHVLIWGISFG